MLICVAVIGILTAIAIHGVGGTKVAVAETKLRRDVANLNNVIKLYVANGGSLDGISDPQEVVEKLKTKMSAEDSRRYVGPVSGRGVDIRLAVRPQLADESATSSARAYWDAAEQQFVVSSRPGTPGIKEFYLDNDQAAHPVVEETRSASNFLYNGQAGWVWASGEHAAPPPQVPTKVALTSPSSPPFAPTIPPPPAIPPLAVFRLPPPIIMPPGGIFGYGSFPSQVTIDPNSAPGGTNSRLIFQLVAADGTARGWEKYTAALTVRPGETVQAINQSLNEPWYGNSPMVSSIYEAKVVALGAPIISPPGGSFTPTLFPSAITIAANGAPGGNASALRYTIKHADGVSTTWLDYNGAVAITNGDTVTAANFSLTPDFYTDSAVDVESYLSTIKKLPPPVLTDTVQNGQRVVVMTMDPSVPPGSYIQYTTSGLDPDINISTNTPKRGTMYKLPISAKTGPLEFLARVYPPKATAADYIVSDLADLDLDFAEASPGLLDGHFDVDTSSKTYALGQGSTDGHVHAYDDKYGTTTINMMQFSSTALKTIESVIPKGVRFKLIVANADLSKGGMLSINGQVKKVTDYDNTDPASLPSYSIDGVSGSTKLDELSMTFAADAIGAGGIMGTVTGAVRSNKPGALGEYRNGALTVQAVAVAADGSPSFSTNTALSNGGVQGVATTGLLWECTVFWHWTGGPYGNGSK